MIDQNVISVHFPKAGGSSLRELWLQTYGDLVEIDQNHDPLIVEGNTQGGLPPGKRLVHGHFRPARYRDVDGFWLTFLREPVDNLISIYFYWKSLPPGHDIHVRFLRERPSILEFAQYREFRTLMSETYFGGFDVNRLTFVGFFDRRRQDMTKLAELLGITLDVDLCLNKTPRSQSRDELMQDGPTLSRLRDLLLPDVKFYERMRTAFTRDS